MARAYEQSRVDLSTASRRTIASHILSMAESFGANRDPATITWMDVQTWVSEAGLKPASLRRYLVTLRGILDYAGVKPNPAADPRVRLPRHVRAVVGPPLGGGAHRADS